MNGIIMEQHYREIFRIDRAYVIGFGDSGMSETVWADGTVDKDDLRLSFELSGGHKFLLTGKQRFYFEDGYLIIEDLFEVK